MAHRTNGMCSKCQHCAGEVYAYDVWNNRSVLRELIIDNFEIVKPDRTDISQPGKGGANDTHLFVTPMSGSLACLPSQ